MIQRYKLFRFKPSEKIKDVFNCFTLITNELVALGKPIADSDLVRKILRILIRDWDVKHTAIEEAQNLNALTLSLLKEKLQAYELHLEMTNRDDVILEPKAEAARRILHLMQ